MNEEENIRILLINDRHEDADDITAHLKKYMRLPWSLTHCINIKEAIPRIHKASIIILELELEGFSSATEIFSEVEDIALEIPIIALAGSGEGNHHLATYVMEMGAADTIIRGQFNRLIDAIEFALIRQKSARILQDNQNQDAAFLQSERNQAVVDLKNSQDNRSKDQEKSRQILRMFMGDYSVDKK